MKEKIAVVTTGYFPVPATRGGAVEALVENLIDENEEEKKLMFHIFSSYDKKAVEFSKKYKNTTFSFIKTPKIIQLLDLMIYFICTKILRKSKGMSYRYILQRLHFIDKVSVALKKNDYDKVVLENHATLFMTLKKRKNYLKYAGRYYYHLHNVVKSMYGCEEVILNTHKVLGVSNYINETLKDTVGESTIKYDVLRNKIDSEKFRRKLTVERQKELKRRFNIKDDELVVLFSGRLNKEKGIKELLLAWKQVPDIKAKLLIVGSYYFGSGMKSPYEEEIKELADQMKDRVVFSGFINYEEMPDILALADIVAAPSMWDEPAALTIIEALSAYKPLITTNTGGTPEYAERGSSIILEPDAKISDNIAHALRMLANDEQKREQMTELLKQKTKGWGTKEFYNDFVTKLED